MTVAELVMCPNCEAPLLASSTRCGECGEPLAPPEVVFDATATIGDPRFADVVGCSCGHNGVCNRCVLFAYDNGIAL